MQFPTCYIVPLDDNFGYASGDPWLAAMGSPGVEAITDTILLALSQPRLDVFVN